MTNAAASDAIQVFEKHDTALSRFVRARLLAYRGELVQAIDGFQSALQAASAPDPDLLLHRARLLAKANRFPEAIADLRSALQLFPPYAFFVKSEKVLDRIIASGHWQPRRKAKLAVLASSTTALLTPVLRAAGFRCGLQLETYEGVYGNYQQEILDPQSGLYRFRPDLVVLLLNSEISACRRRAACGTRRSSLPACAISGRFSSTETRVTSCRSVSTCLRQARGEVWRMRSPKAGDE